MALAPRHHLAHPRLLGVLAVLQLDQPDPVQILHQRRRQIAGLDHGPRRGLPHALAEAPDDKGDQRRAQQHDQRQPPVGPGHIGDHGDQGQAVLGIVDHAVGEGFPHQIGVEQHGRDKAARMLRPQPRQIGPDHRSEQLDLDVADDAVAQPVDQRCLSQGGDRPDQPGPDDDGRNADQRPVGRHGDHAPDRHGLAQEQAVDGRLQQLQHRGRHDPDDGRADQ